MNVIKIGFTLIAKVLIKSFYFVSKSLFPVNPKKITFASYRSEKIQDNLDYVYQEIRQRNVNYSFVFLFKTYKKSILGKTNYLFHMIRASFHLATSRCVFIDDYYFPIYVIKPRNGTEIIQLWHAAGAFKKFGYSTTDKSYGPSQTYLQHVKVHSNYTKVMVSGKIVIPAYAEAFNMPQNRILSLGVPRIDFFYQKERHIKLRARFFEHFPELKGKKLILYAPTYRGKSHGQNLIDCPLDVKTLKTILGEKYALLVHLHPYMHGKMKVPINNNFSYNIDDFSIQDLMVVSDLLITDYSSVIFDYSLLVRPMAFFSYDLDDYLKERDFYYDYQTFIPGPMFKETQSLAKWIQSEQFDLDVIKQFRDRFFDYQDGKNSERIVNNILANK
ncbi:CDP-glycerol glycerophosphotransferase family protein [Camelliibacillus cellulosilyticus]|uniref:CDP-glycerol glycerophosphotransferase family protein n=1 Tax=Camelliibacillus cellulosilyticus TaxID=2174486 RepID=A0ABV9GU55_9BACL